MKKTISLILCLLLVFVFCSCNKEIVTTATTTTESPAMETSQSKPSTMEFSFAFTFPNLEEQIQKSHLLVKATYQCSGTDYIEMEGCEIESFFDRYAVTEVLYGEYTEERIDLGSVKWNNAEKQRLFAISSGIGMDALVCKNTDSTNNKCQKKS